MFEYLAKKLGFKLVKVGDVVMSPQEHDELSDKVDMLIKNLQSWKDHSAALEEDADSAMAAEITYQRQVASQQRQEISLLREALKDSQWYVQFYNEAIHCKGEHDKNEFDRSACLSKIWLALNQD